MTNSMKKISKNSGLFILISLFYLIIVISLFSFLFPVVNQPIEFILMERKGLVLIDSVLEFQQDLLRYRITKKTYLENNLFLRPTLYQMEKKINHDIQEIDGINYKYGESLKSIQKWIELKNAWQSSKNKIFNLNSPINPAQYSNLLNLTSSFVDEIKNTSNLITDPELDSYYLMISIVRDIPKVIIAVNELAVGITPATYRNSKYRIGQQAYLLFNEIRFLNKSINYNADSVFKKIKI